MNTPVLFLIFNRPNTTAKVFATIQQAKPPRLYIAADGPRVDRKEEADLCNKTRAFVLNAIDWECEVHTLFRETNLGCGLAVSEAITWFFSREEMGIILEDDCVPAPSFFDFCEILLYKYQYEERVMMISGLNVLGDVCEFKVDYFFTRMPHVWGWASWRRAWIFYSLKFDGYDQKVFKRFSNKILQKYFFSITDSILKGKTDTWDVQWVYAILKYDGLCVSPTKNLIKNIGHYGVNTNGEIGGFQELDLHSIDVSCLRHPALVERDPRLDLSVQNAVSQVWAPLFEFSLLSVLKRKVKTLFTIYGKK